MVATGIEVDQNDVGLLAARGQISRIIPRLADQAQGGVVPQKRAERLARQFVVAHDQNADALAAPARDSSGLIGSARRFPAGWERFGRRAPRSRFSLFAQSTPV